MEMNWQPIETAPKDSASVKLHFGNEKYPFDIEEACLMFWPTTGYYERVGYDTYRRIDRRPTHWMPSHAKRPYE